MPRKGKGGPAKKMCKKSRRIRAIRVARSYGVRCNPMLGVLQGPLSGQMGRGKRKGHRSRGDGRESERRR